MPQTGSVCVAIGLSPLKLKVRKLSHALTSVHSSPFRSGAAGRCTGMPKFGGALWRRFWNVSCTCPHGCVLQRVVRVADTAATASAFDCCFGVAAATCAGAADSLIFMRLSNDGSRQFAVLLVTRASAATSELKYGGQSGHPRFRYDALSMQTETCGSRMKPFGAQHPYECTKAGQSSNADLSLQDGEPVTC